ncbi:MAG: hypothetical protein L6Q71_04470 [Planctomycetes bacterium]|nr:hypothetical protein [Planctomycetota bacterium]NUQ35911.1 hypothetical protein [Planctomycetaceae bacterium]
MDFARIRRSIPGLLSATLFSAAAVGGISGCSGNGSDDEAAGAAVAAFLMDDRDNDADEGFVVVSDTGEITAVVDTNNNIVDVYNTANAPAGANLLVSIDLNEIKVLSTDANPVFKDLDPDGTDDDATDIYDADGDDVISVTAAAIHPSDEFMVIGINDADDNDDGDITRSPSRLLWITLVDLAADVDDDTGAALPAREAGDYLGVTDLRVTDDDDDAEDGEINFFNITGVAFTPNGEGMGVIGNYPDAIDLGSGANTGPDGDTNDEDDIGTNAANEFRVEDSTIAFLGQDGFDYGGDDALPLTAEALRAANFAGDPDRNVTLDNFGVDLSDDHAFPDAAAQDEFIAVLAPDRVGQNSASIEPEFEDARDSVDDHDISDGDTGIAVTGIVVAGTNDENEVLAIQNATGLDAVAIPQALSFSAGSDVSDGAGAIHGGAGDGLADDLPTDSLFTFVADVDADADHSAVFITGFGLRGDFQARAASGGSSFGSSSFISDGNDKLAVAVTVPSTGGIVVCPVNTVVTSENFLYGELLNGTTLLQSSFGAEAGLGLAAIDGYSAGGDLFFAVANSDTDDSVIGIYEIDYTIATTTNDDGDVVVLQTGAVSVVDSSYKSSASENTGAAGPGAMSIGHGNPGFFAVFNGNDQSLAFIND